MKSLSDMEQLIDNLSRCLVHLLEQQIRYYRIDSDEQELEEIVNSLLTHFFSANEIWTRGLSVCLSA